MSMDKRHLIPLLTTEEFRQFPDQTTEILNRLITEVNDRRNEIVELTNAIIVLQNQVKNLGPSPTPTGEWEQVLNFDLNAMGNTPYHCLQNTREGFHISTGTFLTARADMESQIANGTLHAGTPPADIAVPIYYDNIYAEGHVAVWDHGVVYSDKQYYGSIEDVTNGYTGWGELCDGVRVVTRS